MRRGPLRLAQFVEVDARQIELRRPPGRLRGRLHNPLFQQRCCTCVIAAGHRRISQPVERGLARSDRRQRYRRDRLGALRSGQPLRRLGGRLYAPRGHPTPVCCKVHTEPRRRRDSPRNRADPSVRAPAAATLHHNPFACSRTLCPRNHNRALDHRDLRRLRRHLDGKHGAGHLDALARRPHDEVVRAFRHPLHEQRATREIDRPVLLLLRAPGSRGSRENRARKACWTRRVARQRGPHIEARSRIHSLCRRQLRCRCLLWRGHRNRSIVAHPAARRQPNQERRCRSNPAPCRQPPRGPTRARG